MSVPAFTHAAVTTCPSGAVVEYGAFSTFTPVAVHCEVPPFASVDELITLLGEAGLAGCDPHDASASASDTEKSAAVRAKRRCRSGLLMTLTLKRETSDDPGVR